MKLIKFLFFENYTIITQLSESEVSSRIEDIMEPKKSLKAQILTGSYSKKYVGEISGGTFTMPHFSFMQNKLSSKTSGNIFNLKGKTCINIDLYNHTKGLAILYVFVTAFLIAVIPFNRFEKTINSDRELMFFYSFLILFLILIPTIATKIEIAKTKKYLMKLLDAEN